jgi:signal transduction histidine kinase
MGISRLWIERAAIALGLIAVSIGVLTPIVAKSDTGVSLMVANGQVLVASVDPAGPGAAYGFEPGMVAVTLNDRFLVRLPEYVQPESDATPDPETGEVPAQDPIVSPLVPTPEITGDAELRGLVDTPLVQLQAVRPADLAAWNVDTSGVSASIYDDGRASVQDSILFVVFGIGVLFAIAWWLGTGRAGAEVVDLGLPLAVAAASPFLLQPLNELWAPLAVAAHAVLIPLAMLPLAASLLNRIDGAEDQRIALVASATCAIGAVVIGSARSVSPSVSGLSLAAGLLAAGIAAVPGLIAADRPLADPSRASETPGNEATASGRVLRSAELAIAGATPAVALLTVASSSPWLFVLWFAAIAVTGKFTVRPLVRLASRAQLQRDLVVAATEAERARVAADIHDDALQELTLLVRRLEVAGDAEGAELARGVSDRLRAICGDLRLPILDDLGVGPALDWLVLRIEKLAGGTVRLERVDGARAPADVELAFFRIAQEALSNAVKHGRTPIVVRFRATDGGASLSIDDAGPGIAADAGERAEREGHFGLLNMQQRAEGIGAILDVRRWPAGGTHVQLDWRQR